jgi:hypothetical protein
MAIDAPAPIVEPALAKLSPDLIALIADEKAANTIVRLDVILFRTAEPNDPEWRSRMMSAANLGFEGVAGNVVTIAALAGAARQLAALPEVASVRLPRPAAAAIPSGGIIRPADALKATHLDQLHTFGGAGQGVKIAIVDSDFAGLKVFLRRSLPAKTKLLDLTAERNSDLIPDPITDDHPGRGTLAALAAAKAAPRAELLLVRVDAAAPHQVLTVARAVAGEAFRTESMRVRRAEIVITDDQLRQSRIRLNDELGDTAGHLPDDAVLPHVRSREVERWFANDGSELPERLARVVQRVRSLDPRLRRDAADAKARAAKLGLLLDADDLRAELCGADRRRIAPRAASEDGDIELAAGLQNGMVDVEPAAPAFHVDIPSLLGLVVLLLAFYQLHFLR